MKGATIAGCSLPCYRLKPVLCWWHHQRVVTLKGVSTFYTNVTHDNTLHVWYHRISKLPLPQTKTGINQSLYYSLGMSINNSVMGLINNFASSLSMTLISTFRTLLSSLGNTLVMCPRGHWLRLDWWSFIRTTRPYVMSCLFNCHFFLGCSHDPKACHMNGPFSEVSPLVLRLLMITSQYQDCNEVSLWNDDGITVLSSNPVITRGIWPPILISPFSSMRGFSVKRGLLFRIFLVSLIHPNSSAKTSCCAARMMAFLAWINSSTLYGVEPQCHPLQSFPSLTSSPL